MDFFLCQGGPKDFVFSQKKLSPKVAQFCEKKKNWNFLTLTPTFLHLHEEEEVAKLEKKLSKTCLSSFLTAFEKKNFFDNKNFKGEPKRKKIVVKEFFFPNVAQKRGKIILNNFGKKNYFDSNTTLSRWSPVVFISFPAAWLLPARYSRSFTPLPPLPKTIKSRQSIDIVRSHNINVAPSFGFRWHFGAAGAGISLQAG